MDEALAESFAPRSASRMVLMSNKSGLGVEM
jgi:hypothetical protein